VLQSGMGEIAPVGDAEGLAKAILRVLSHREAYQRSRQEIAERWSIESTAKKYEALYQRMLRAA
jgi:glycosyltransferase involved in cell wall biosynthesis